MVTNKHTKPVSSRLFLRPIRAPKQSDLRALGSENSWTVVRIDVNEEIRGSPRRFFPSQFEMTSTDIPGSWLHSESTRTDSKGNSGSHADIVLSGVDAIEGLRVNPVCLNWNDGEEVVHMILKATPDLSCEGSLPFAVDIEVGENF